MAPFLALLLLVVPVLELAVIVQVSEEVGVLNTLGLLVVVSIAGAWLLKQQGVATWRSLQATMARGQMPTKEATDGALILFGGALLLTPGFVTDAVGLLFLVPPARALVKGGFRKLLGAWAAKRFGAAGKAARAGGPVYSAKVTRARRSDAPPSSSGSAGRLPAEDPPDDGDGSPGTG